MRHSLPFLGDTRYTPPMLQPSEAAALLFLLAVSQPGGLVRPELADSVIPAPRQINLTDSKIVLDHNWKVETAPELAGNIAIRWLLKDFAEFHGLALDKGAGRRTIRLSVRPGAVSTGAPAEIDRQAYALRIEPDRIEITGNGQPGLLYGVQTLVQLARRDLGGQLVVPAGVIEDWPALPLRFLHWDAQQHQDRVETLKRYLDWAARLKANMIAFQLEDKFEFPSHPVIGAPGAYTTAQLQELVDYALERHIQIVPMIQAPAHFSWALKHPEFAELRSDGNNYQANTCDPRAMRLIFDLYDDVIQATKGVEYLFVSTDEIYYAGIDPRCGRPYTPENRSLAWVEFVKQAHEHVAKKRGRNMLIWGEYPLLAEHVKLLPADVIDGVSMEEDYLAEEQKLGMRQLLYVWTQGVELHFPDYLGAEGREGWRPGHLERVGEQIAKHRLWAGKPVGVFGAAWDASGLHNEAFWLGWSAAAQWGWSPGKIPWERHMAEFLRLYYGPSAESMSEIYRLMQHQARAWERSWDRVPSRVRGPAYGNSRGKGIGVQRWDETLDPPPLPSLPSLKRAAGWREKHNALIAGVRLRREENERLALLLETNLGKFDRNRYNLEVFLSIAHFIDRHWRLVDAMAQADRLLADAEAESTGSRHDVAAGRMVAAYNRIDRLVKERAEGLRHLRAVWEKSRYPRGQTVGGREFLNINDDSKDYWAQRRPDMSYLTAPEESIGLDKWCADLRQVMESYAKQHNVTLKEILPGDEDE